MTEASIVPRTGDRYVQRVSSHLRSGIAWALLASIVLVMLPALLLYVCLVGRRDASRTQLRLWVARWVSVYGWMSPLYRFRLEGREKLPRKGAYVLIANHESGLDALALLMLSTSARFFADEWMFRAAWSGWLMRLCRHIAIRHDDPEQGRRSIEQGKRAVRDGSAVAIFPEGRYSKGELGELKIGAFLIAKSESVPIFPVRIDGAGQAWRPGSVVVRGRHEISVVVCEPISVDQIEVSSAEELRDTARASLCA